MENITIVYSYYGQEDMIDRIIREKHPNTRVVIIDDCSLKPLRNITGLDIYRIDDDIKWNITGAKNLGVQESEGWLVLSDIDHLITRDNVEDILKIDKKIGTMYLFGRKPIREGEKERLLIEQENHCTTFLIHKDDFNKIGGYNEDFAGNYGYDDIDFILRAKGKVVIEERRDIKASLYEESFVKNLKRDETVNKELFNSDRALGSKIRFKWHKI